LIGSLTAAFAQSLGLIQAEGIDVETFMAVLRQSALYAPTFDKKLKRMEGRHFADPNFPTKHLLKDMGLFVDTASGGWLRGSPCRQCAPHGGSQAVDAGFADDDYSSLYNILNPPDSREIGAGATPPTDKVGFSLNLPFYPTLKGLPS
jgi:3-hydroxyisobutyrate dehydrogenase